MKNPILIPLILITALDFLPPLAAQQPEQAVQSAHSSLTPSALLSKSAKELVGIAVGPYGQVFDWEESVQKEGKPDTLMLPPGLLAIIKFKTVIEELGKPDRTSNERFGNLIDLNGKPKNTSVHWYGPVGLIFGGNEDESTLIAIKYFPPHYTTKIGDIIR